MQVNQTGNHTRRKWRFSLWLVVAVTAVLIGPSVAARLLLNVAQLARLHDHNANAAYRYALALAPHDSHIRWQAGVALAERGEATTAASILLPLAQHEPVNAQVATVLFVSLARAGRASEALSIYQSLREPPALSAPAAATLAGIDWASTPHTAPPTDEFMSLLAQALGLPPNSGEFQILAEQVTDPGFWSSALAQRLLRSLSWKSQEQTATNRPADDGDDLAKLAEVLQVAPSQLRLGQELAVNGGFEERHTASDMPQGWIPSLMTTGNPWNRAAFVLGTDAQQAVVGHRSARIDGLQIERRSEREPARAGFWHPPIELGMEKPYVISFAYRTENVEDAVAAMWLSPQDAAFMGYGQERSFPPTDGEWKRVTIVGWNRTGQNVTIAPLLRSFGIGSVWFDDFSVRPIELEAGTQAQPQAAWLRIEDVKK